MQIDPVSKSVLQVIRDCGYQVTATDGLLTAICNQTGEQFIIRFGCNVYPACIALAEKIGIDLEDG
jgi:hypothetical protein